MIAAAIRVTEGSGQGTDLIWSSASTFTISENVENLYLKGSSDIDATGNNAANVIRGNSGENNLDGVMEMTNFLVMQVMTPSMVEKVTIILNGGAGNDAMSGGAGDDTYIS